MSIHDAPRSFRHEARGGAPARWRDSEASEKMPDVPAALADLLERLVAIDSVNPTLVPGGAGEGVIARFVAQWLREQGLDVRIDEVADGRPNVIATARGSGSGRSLVLNAHTDTVGFGAMRDPLVPRIEGGRLYGRGAYDMKGSLAAIMMVAAEACERGVGGDVVVTAVADEEAASVGTEDVARRVRADAAIVAEPTDLAVALAHKGFVWLEVETHGRAAHGSRYDLGVDAITKMGHVLVGLERLDRALRDAETLHPLLDGGSVHAGVIHGGEAVSVYPDRCVVHLERRTVPGETPELAEREIRALLGDLDGDVRVPFSRDPLETSGDEEIVRLVAKHAREALGREAELIGVPFWTDAALLAARGIPTVVFGPPGEGAHADVEWVDLEGLERLYEILLATVLEFCA